ncbi:MAG: HAD family hydrolase [Lachnospiraceae bacterium]|nr:HAD family hydrolase [Lachnospiraceae bacterium]
MITTVLFDLDGTLLPMDMDEFTNGYFKLLAGKMAGHGFEPEALMKGIYKGMAAMAKNNGTQTNEEAFWQSFCGVFGEKVREKEEAFIDFYKNEFNLAKKCCGFTEKAKKVIDILKEKEIGRVLATNPIFPEIATRNRIAWAGLSPADFSYISVYENSTYAKPNPAYFEEVLKKCSLNPNECIMIGNDAEEDLAAQEVGIPVFLLTDCLVNTKGKDISRCRKGNFDDLIKLVEEL